MSDTETLEVDTDPIQSFLNWTVIDNPYIPITPTIPQFKFLLSQEDEVLYGGSGGGGKSYSLLAAALQYVMLPQYDAIILRRQFPDLTQPKSLIPTSFEWLAHSDAQWSDRQHKWTFPNGSTLSFGHMNSEKDKFSYKGAAFSFVGYDELTEYTETMYTYLFTRIRRGIGVNIPSRMRSTSNPGSEGHEWVKTRFLQTPPGIAIKVPDEQNPGDYSTRLFIPAKFTDNPHIDQRAYRLKLSQVDAITRAQMEHGDWDIIEEGNIFKRAWFKVVDSPPDDIVSTVRAWDLAATPVTARNPDPDWSTGVKMSRTKRNTFFIHNILRRRVGPGEVEEMLKRTAEEDGVSVPIWIEQEPGASGKTVIYNYASKVLPRFAVKGIAVSGAGGKVDRARPLSAASERGDVSIMRAPWNSAWLDHMSGFPGMAHDDDADAASHAFNCLASEINIKLPKNDISVYRGG